MKNLSIVELYLIKNRIIKEGMQNDPLMDDVCNAIREKESMILEDGSSVVASQPSSLAGSTIGTNWSSNGGTTGSGDISHPYNPGGGPLVSQKVPVQMGTNHGGRTGKKTRKKRMTMKTLQQLRNTLSQKQDFTKTGEPKSKVMNFDNFQKANLNQIKKD